MTTNHDDSETTVNATPTKRPRRSTGWTGNEGINGFIQRASLKVHGLRDRDFDRPIIGICNNTSEYTRCHLHFDGMVRAVSEAVLQCGGLPRTFNTMTMGAEVVRPMGVSFMHRNLLAMEIEQTAHTYPMDGLVMLGACDETIPAMLMTAASLDLPAIVLPGGPSITGFWRGHDVGTGYDVSRAFEALSRGEIGDKEIHELEESLERSAGHCSTMGTAGTMTAIAEALGMAPAGSCAIPAVDSRRLAMSRQVGEYIMDMVARDLRPSQIMTAAALDNAIRLLATVDGSTNAVMHLLAVAGRLGIDLTLERFDALSADTPKLLNLRPAGEFYMNDFFNAGGVPALLNALGPLVNRDILTVTGRTLGEEIAGVAVKDSRVIGSLDAPFASPRGIAVLRGNIAPDGAIVRAGVISQELKVHRGRALVFDGRADLQARLYDPEMDIQPEDVIVLRGEGPIGSAGMPESGKIPLPDKLVRQGVIDMVRVTDGRIGGTVDGTNVLHVTPEAAVGGPLGLVRDGDVIVLDVPGRRISVEVSDDELARRRAEVGPPSPRLPARGFARLYVERVQQANLGCDFDFLRAPTTSAPSSAPSSDRTQIEKVAT